MHLLVFGKSGQVARALAAAVGGRHSVALAGRPQYDITDFQVVKAAVAAEAPAVIVNAAAHTAVDRAETAPETARAVNHAGAANVARAAAEAGLPLLQVSTDYVFDGAARTPYAEDAGTGPLNVYGASKLDGERAVAAATPKHLIVRTSWVFDAGGGNFVDTMLGLAATRDRLNVVDDQRAAPTAAAAVARALLRMAETAVGDGFAEWGVYHFQARPVVSWCGFARAIFAAWAELTGAPVPEVTAIPTRDYPTPARRPLYGVLATDRIDRVFGIKPPDWRQDLRQVLTARAVAAGA